MGKLRFGVQWPLVAPKKWDAKPGIHVGDRVVPNLNTKNPRTQPTLRAARKSVLRPPLRCAIRPKHVTFAREVQAQGIFEANHHYITDTISVLSKKNIQGLIFRTAKSALETTFYQQEYKKGLTESSWWPPKPNSNKRSQEMAHDQCERWKIEVSETPSL